MKRIAAIMMQARRSEADKDQLLACNLRRVLADLASERNGSSDFAAAAHAAADLIKNGPGTASQAECDPV